MEIKPLFDNRIDAGRKLAEALTDYQEDPNVIVLALPRGGVPVAHQVAESLDAPMDIFLVRKLGLPGHEELAMGAIASGGVCVLNESVVAQLENPEVVIDEVVEKEQMELERREQAYRGDRPVPELEGRTVILVDDGLATGASMRAAVAGLRARNPQKIVVAVPTASPETCEQFENEVDEVVCAVTPQPFFGIGYWYDDFSQTTDEEVRHILEEARN
ncbi:MAG: phosphoribosyltransferase [Chloroflexota bacterium]|jgi:predicted phosphoribosyltransferase